MKTYNIVFNDSIDSNDMGFRMSYDYCYNYIQQANGSNSGYFSDYKGGTVSIVCNETNTIVYETIVL